MGVSNFGSIQLDDGPSGATPITGFKLYAPTLTPVSVAATTVAEQTFSVPGLTIGDKVFINPPVNGTATGLCGYRVSATDTLALRFVNPTAGALIPSAGVFQIMAFRT